MLPDLLCSRLCLQTGKYCRAVTDNNDGLTKILCDQDTIATASNLTYAGRALSYNSEPFINPGNNGWVPALRGGAASQAQLCAAAMHGANQ